MAAVIRSDGWVKAVTGAAVPGAQVFVCNQPANTPNNLSPYPPTPLASIFSDNGGLVPIVQPIITDGFGHYDFYTASGTYTVIVYLNGTLQQIYPDQNIGGSAGQTYTGGTGISIVGSVISSTVVGMTTGGATGQVLAKSSDADFATTWVTPSAASVELQTNGTPNSDQALLNLKDGAGIGITADGSGGATVSVTSIPTDLQVYDQRIWRASPNTANITSDVGFASSSNNGTSPGSIGIITATAAEANLVSFPTSSANPSQQVQSFLGSISISASPPVTAVWSTQTLKGIRWRGALQNLSTIRVWLGVSDYSQLNFTSLRSNSPSGLNMIAFRYATSAGDTNWQAVCNDTTGQTVVDTGVPADTSGHTFMILIDSTSQVRFLIGGVVVATITTHIPAASVRMADLLSVDNDGSANVVSAALGLCVSSEK